MRWFPKRLVIVAAVGATGFLIASNVSMRNATKTTRANAKEPLVGATDDVGPPEDSSPVVSFDPAFEGAPNWTTVTYTTSSGQCFDANAEWNGTQVGSVGACGFGAEVDALLLALGRASATDIETLIRDAGITTPFVVVEGYVAAPDESRSYGVVTGIVGCDCQVTARWADGAVAEAKVVNGVFLIQRDPVDQNALKRDDTSVTSVEIS